MLVGTSKDLDHHHHQETTSFGVFPNPELIANLSISKSPSSFNQNQIKPSLSEVPLEIKQCIIYWIHEYEKENAFFCDNDDDDDSDIELVDDDEFRTEHPTITKTVKSPSAKKLKDSFENGKTDKQQLKNNAEADVDLKSSLPPMRPLFALSLVNKTFYELCRPFIWEGLDLEGCTIPKLKRFLSVIIPRQSHHIQTLWWRVSHAELEEFEQAFDQKSEANLKEDWDEEERSRLLFQILKSCSKISNLDIDLRPASIDNDGNFIPPTKHDPMFKFLTPISQLTSLTSLALTAPSDGDSFNENFLAYLIKDLTNLQSFTCSSIDASSSSSSFKETCHSPLALRLASLTRLDHLDLDDARCFNCSWAKIEWRGSLKTIALDDCSAITLPGLHAFCMLFSSTLVNLELTNVPNFDTLTQSEHNDLDGDSFSGCKSLSLLELGESSTLVYDDIERLIREENWPKLTRLGILNDYAILTESEIEALELYCLSKGIFLDIETSDDSSSEDDEEEYDQLFVDDSEDDPNRDALSELEDLQDGWQE
ncbi:hypothetical protein O181_068589 [Austropuccinia psidii MF-1]|uniref:Uncharacterized protein n=1 Tax=Austropuccinia psidii MF-1 TaxID=1389203 RepID=A0A9Q3EXL1_9BASI|nr:hypothetical protein [Austropuccinia psidii MF-1]